MRALWVVCLLLAFGRCLAAPPAVVLSILDGKAVLTIGARSFEATEGLRLPEGTIVETSDATTLLQLEWPDGQAVDLGPQTRVMIQPPGLARRGEPAPALYVLRGWVKQRGPANAPHRGLVAPQLDVLPSKAVSVISVGPDKAWLFVESGSASVVERPGSGPKLNLAAGQSYLREGWAKGDVGARPDAALLKQMPRSFRDTIALRADRFKDRDVEPKSLPAPDYKALQEWLTAEPPLRRDFPRRFAPLARESGFRGALVSHLASHPEWERLLFPERFVVRPASAVTGVHR